MTRSRRMRRWLSVSVLVLTVLLSLPAPAAPRQAPGGLPLALYLPLVTDPLLIGRWQPTTSMSTPRSYHTATLLPNGQVLVAGGSSTYGAVVNTSLGTAELYDPARDVWTPTDHMTIGHEVHTATLLPDGTVLVAGGQSDCFRWSCTERATVERFDFVAAQPAGGLR